MREKLQLRELADEVIEGAVVRTSSRVVLFNQVPADLVVDADREQLNRVLTNLLRNAIQALEGRQFELDDAPEGHVTVKSWRQGSVAMIEVKDNGPGIPERVRPRLFEAFQSAAKAGGVGLGLAISSELMRAHGGDLRLTATGPEGTVFVITLPDSVAELRTGRRGERRSTQER